MKRKGTRQQYLVVDSGCQPLARDPSNFFLKEITATSLVRWDLKVCSLTLHLPW